MQRAVALLAASLLLIPACVQKEETVGEKRQAPEARSPQGIVISSLLEDADRYRGEEVTVSGKVTVGMAFEFVSEQPFQLDDGTGSLWVVTTGAVPGENQWVTVRGTVAAPYQIKGRRYDVALVEAQVR